MNETHRGCRSPGGFFFALMVRFGVLSSTGVLSRIAALR